MKKKRIVENDKAKILQTIEELDQKKNEALNVAWQKVYFSAPLFILSPLLILIVTLLCFKLTIAGFSVNLISVDVINQ